jgi:hypothetical protein
MLMKKAAVIGGLFLCEIVFFDAGLAAAGAIRPLARGL